MNQQSGQEIIKQLMEEGSHTKLRDELREAREFAINDSENYDQLLFAIERLGCKLSDKAKTLGGYKTIIKDLGKLSVLSEDIPEVWRELHTPISELFEIITQARNDALHQGAYARHLNENTIQLSIILEDALMSESQNICDFMVRNPVCAESWQPISFIRQKMLANSFSYLPVFYKDDWYVVSDSSLARYLRINTDRNQLLGKSLKKAIEEDSLSLEKVRVITISDEMSVKKILESNNHLPVLIGSLHNKSSLIGILTMFDLL